MGIRMFQGSGNISRGGSKFLGSKYFEGGLNFRGLNVLRVWMFWGVLICWGSKCDMTGWSLHYHWANLLRLLYVYLCRDMKGERWTVSAASSASGWAISASAGSKAPDPPRTGSSHCQSLPPSHTVLAKSPDLPPFSPKSCPGLHWSHQSGTKEEQLGHGQKSTKQRRSVSGRAPAKKQTSILVNFAICFPVSDATIPAMERDILP